MKGERAGRCRMLRQTSLPRHLLDFRYQVQPGRRQRWGVKNLANVTSCFRPVVVRMQKRQARCDIEQ